MASYLDTDGLSTVWSRIVSMVDSKISESSITTSDACVCRLADYLTIESTELTSYGYRCPQSESERDMLSLTVNDVDITNFLSTLETAIGLKISNDLLQGTQQGNCFYTSSLQPGAYRQESLIEIAHDSIVDQGGTIPSTITPGWLCAKCNLVLQYSFTGTFNLDEAYIQAPIKAYPILESQDSSEYLYTYGTLFSYIIPGSIFILIDFAPPYLAEDLSGIIVAG